MVILEKKKLTLMTNQLFLYKKIKPNWMLLLLELIEKLSGAKL